MTEISEIVRELEKYEEFAPLSCLSIHPETPGYTTGTVLRDTRAARELIQRLSAATVQGWQPIETLPRDGRWVLAYRPLAMETGDEPLAMVKTTKHPTKSPQGVEHWTSRWCHPTHWMDVPAPPNDPAKGALTPAEGDK